MTPLITSLLAQLESLPPDKDVEERCRLYSELADAWQAEDRDQKAIDCYLSVLSLLKDHSDRDSQLRCRETCLELGHLYRGLGNHKETGVYYQKALALSLSLFPLDTPSEELATAYFALGDFLDQLFKFEPAISYYEQALSLMTVACGASDYRVSVIAQKLKAIILRQASFSATEKIESE